MGLAERNALCCTAAGMYCYCEQDLWLPMSGLQGHTWKMPGQSAFLAQLEGFEQLWDRNGKVTDEPVNRKSVSPWEVH